MSVKKSFINKYNNLTLFDFAHIPKCAGQYFAEFFKSDSQINMLGHIRDGKKKDLPLKRLHPLNKFTIIREPLSRFESYLNYSLEFGYFQKYFPYDLLMEKDDKGFDLNYMVSQMSDDFIVKGEGLFRNYTFWTEGMDYVFTIHQFEKIYEILNDNFREKLNDPKAKMYKNKSSKHWGSFDLRTKTRLKKLFHKDIVIFNKFDNQPF